MATEEMDNALKTARSILVNAREHRKKLESELQEAYKSFRNIEDKVEEAICQVEQRARILASTADPDGVPGFPDIQSMLENHADGLTLNDDASESLENINEFGESIADVVQVSASTIMEETTDIQNFLNGAIENFAEAADKFEDQATNIRESLQKAASSFDTQIQSSVENISELITEVATASGDETDALTDQAIEQLIDQIEELADHQLGEALTAIEHVNSTIADAFGGIDDKLGEVSDTLSDIVSIVEPALPVLEEMATVT